MQASEHRFWDEPEARRHRPLRAELVQRLALARTSEEIVPSEEAEHWLCNRPYDEDVRAASKAARERRIRLFTDEQKREGG